MLSWFMSVLPDSFLLFVFYSLFFAGMALIVASWFVTFIPLISKYRFPTQVIGIVVLALGAYTLGGFEIDQVWKERVRQLEAKLHDAEVKSQETNVVIQEKIVYKTKIVEKKTVQYVDRIKEIAKEVDAKCEVDPRIVEQLNKAAEDPKEAK